MRASALIPRQYRYKFGRDLIQDMQTIQKEADKAKKLALHLRIPQWCEGARLSVNGKQVNSYMKPYLNEPKESR